MNKITLINPGQHSNMAPIAAKMTSPVPVATAKANEQCAYCVTKTLCEAKRLKHELPTQQQLFRTHRVSKGQHIFYAGDSLSNLYLIKSGLFKTYLNSEAGDEQVMGFQMPGEVLGADALAWQVHSLSAMALEASTVCTVSIRQLESVANQFTSHWLIRQVYQETLRQRHILLITGRKYSADTRVAYFLTEMSARNKARGYSGQEFKLNMPHRDIAHYLDMALETVSRVFTRLQDRGILIIERPYVTIINNEKLRALAKIPLPSERLSA